jgi:hypothetical protein
MEDILATHTPVPLTDTQENEIEKILKEEREYYRKREFISEKAWNVYKHDLSSMDYPYA